MQPFDIAGGLDVQSTRLGKQLAAAAGDLRRLARDLETRETVPAGSADLATRSAEAIDRIGDYLQTTSGETWIVDLETFARERPWAVAAVALTAGFAASRVVKASSGPRDRSSRRDDA